MTYSRAVVERAGELRRSGLSCREIARELDGPSKSAVARWTRAGAAGGTVGRAVAKMDLPKVVGDGPVYPDIDPDDKDALIERLILENAVLRAVNDVLKAASLDGMSNREKTLVIDRLRPCGKWSLRELTSSLGISKSSYEYQRRAIARPDRLAPLRALVRRIFTEDGEGARGYRFVTARLRELDEPVRASEKVVLRIMREEGLVPRWMRRKRRPYSSYAGEPTPAPPNLVRRDFRSALPNFLWLTDITEFRLPSGRKVYLSAIRDCFDSSVVAWRAGERPDAVLANSTLEDACARLAPGERPVIHSDRGGHYRWPGWISICEDNDLTRSMSAKGCSPDNAAMEGFFGLLKREFWHGRDWSGWAPPLHRGARGLDRPLQYGEAQRCARRPHAGRVPRRAGKGRVAVQEIVRSPGLKRKMRPGIKLQNGMHFPVESVWETASRNRVSRWDALSLWVRFGKLRPGIKLQSGMRFPKWPPSGNCVPEFELGVGCAFPLGALWETASQFERLFRDAVSAEGFIWKVRPVFSARTGTRFPL